MTTQKPQRPFSTTWPLALLVGVLWTDLTFARAVRAARAAGPSADALAPTPWPAVHEPAAGPPPDTTVYRCGNTYSPHACAHPDAKPLDVDDARTAEQRAQGRELTARDKRLAAWLEAQRHGRDGLPAAPGKRPARAGRNCGTTTVPASTICPDRPQRPRRAFSKAAAKTTTAATATTATPSPAARTTATAGSTGAGH